MSCRIAFVPWSRITYHVSDSNYIRVIANTDHIAHDGVIEVVLVRSGAPNNPEVVLLLFSVMIFNNGQ